MLVRVVRAVLGSVLLLVGLPLLLAGGVLWFAMQHRDAAGGYTASLAEISTDGYAVVASDVDGLLRRDAPFARGGRTTLRVTADTESGPAFVGLAPAAEVARYLSGVPHTQVDEVRLARGPLPVALAPVPGETSLEGPPHEQPFWQAASGAGTLEWVPSQVRGKQLALVVMDREGRAPLSVDVAAEVRPQWLSTTTFGALVLGTVLVLLGIAALVWPTRAREVVYVVPPAQMPEIAAHLGVPVPPEDAVRPEALAETRWPLDPAPPADPEPPAVPAPPAVPEPAGPDAADPDPVPAADTPVPLAGVDLVDSVDGVEDLIAEDGEPPQWPFVLSQPTAAPAPAPQDEPDEQPAPIS